MKLQYQLILLLLITGTQNNISLGEPVLNKEFNFHLTNQTLAQFAHNSKYRIFQNMIKCVKSQLDIQNNFKKKPPQSNSLNFQQINDYEKSEVYQSVAFISNIFLDFFFMRQYVYQFMKRQIKTDSRRVYNTLMRIPLFPTIIVYCQITLLTFSQFEYYWKQNIVVILLDLSNPRLIVETERPEISVENPYFIIQANCRKKIQYSYYNEPLSTTTVIIGILILSFSIFRLVALQLYIISIVFIFSTNLTDSYLVLAEIVKFDEKQTQVNELMRDPETFRAANIVSYFHVLPPQVYQVRRYQMGIIRFGWFGYLLLWAGCWPLTNENVKFEILDKIDQILVDNAKVCVSQYLLNFNKVFLIIFDLENLSKLVIGKGSYDDVYVRRLMTNQVEEWEQMTKAANSQKEKQEATKTKAQQKSNFRQIENKVDQLASSEKNVLDQLEDINQLMMT